MRKPAPFQVNYIPETMLQLASALAFNADDLRHNRKRRISGAQRLRLFKQSLLQPLLWAMAPVALAIGFRIGVAFYLESAPWTDILEDIAGSMASLNFREAAAVIWSTEGSTPAYYNWISFAILASGTRQIKRLPFRLLIDVLFGRVNKSEARTTTYTTEREFRRGRLKENESVYMCQSGDLDFEVSREAYEALGRVGVYRLYYTRLSKVLLSAEPVVEVQRKAAEAAAG